MARVKSGAITSRRHKKVLSQTKGYRMTKNRLYKVAHEAYLHAGQYAYIGRKQKKRNFRRLWITRISAALSQLAEPIRYSLFVSKLKANNIKLDRKILAELAVEDPEAFAAVAKESNQ
jgi:large subunit ribosomal protein L20